MVQVKPLAFVSNNDKSASKLLESYGFSITYDHTADDIKLACFTGGADICPLLYGQKVHKTTAFSVMRDQDEIKAWKHFAFEQYDLPKIGICRGMQLGNVMLGGALYQNVDGHEGQSKSEHRVKVLDKKGDRFSNVNSYHHQMVIPPSDMRVLVIADESTKLETDIAHKQVTRGAWCDIEAIYHPYTNFLGVQWHPEWHHPGGKEVFEELLFDHLKI